MSLTYYNFQEIRKSTQRDYLNGLYLMIRNFQVYNQKEQVC